MRAAQLGVSMGDAVLAWLQVASVPGPLVTAQDAVKPLVMDVDELRAAVVGVPARPSTTSEPVVYDEMAPALTPAQVDEVLSRRPSANVVHLPGPVREKAFTGPFSKAAQMGKK